MIVDRLKNVYCIDTMLNGERNAICSYMILAEKVCIVDCGPTAAANEIINAANELGVSDDVSYIAVTHVHLDHGGGAGRLLKHFENAKVLVHPNGFKHLLNPNKLWNAAKSVLGDLAMIYQPPEPCNESRVIAVEDDEKIDLGDCTIKVIHTPGHASHHTSFYLAESDILFTGDSAGMYYKGMIVPTTPPPFDFKKSLESIEKMSELNPKTLAFTHFGFGDGKLLEKIYVKTVEWVNIAKEVVDNGRGVNEVYQKTLEYDLEFKKLLNIFKDSYIIRKSYMLGFLGLVEAVRGD